MTEMSRIHLALPADLLNRINWYLPTGIRSEVCRSAIEILMDAIDEHGTGMIGLVLSKDVTFKPKPSTRQNLTASKENEQDEKQRYSSQDN